MPGFDGAAFYSGLEPEEEILSTVRTPTSISPCDSRKRTQQCLRPTKGPRLGGGPAHERLMLANLATALFTHGRIQTTETKAKRLRPLAERMVTFAKRGDLHARRQVS